MRNDRCDDTRYAEQSLGPLFEQPKPEDPFDRSEFRPTSLEAQIGRLIWQHKGRDHPISIARIRELTTMSDRAIKDVVESLIVTHKMRIGARRDAPAGYFVIETIEDQQTAVKPYRSQILAMLRRLRVLESPEEIRKFLGQMALELEG